MGIHSNLLCQLLLLLSLSECRSHWHPVFQNVTFDSPRLSLSKEASPQGTKLPKTLIHKGRMHLSNNHTSDALHFLLLAMQRGVQLAKDILQSVCADIDLRVAPLIYEDMQTTGTLMQVSSPFVLMQLEMYNIHNRMGYVFVPSALVRGLLKNPINKVVWTNPDGNVGYQPSANEEAELLAQMWHEIPHDVYISINTQVDFALGDSDCALVSNSHGYYSVVSTLLHELLHGAGVYSLIEKDRSGGLQGHASVFDALLKHGCSSCDNQDATAGCYVFDRQNIHHLTGDQLAGQSLCVNESQVYNPGTFSVGSSLSHFHEASSVMSSSITHSTCRFELTSQDLLALHYLGWQTCNQTHAPHVWFTQDTLLPASVMSQIHGIDGASSNHDGSNSSTSSKDDQVITKVVYCNDNFYYYTHPSACYDTAHEVLATIFVCLFFLGIFFCCIWACRDADSLGYIWGQSKEKGEYKAADNNSCMSSQMQEQSLQLAHLIQPKNKNAVFVIE